VVVILRARSLIAVPKRFPFTRTPLVKKDKHDCTAQGLRKCNYFYFMLPAEMAAHLVTAGTAPTGELVLTMDASVWAARMRYHAEQFGGQRVKIKVQPQG